MPPVIVYVSPNHCPACNLTQTRLAKRGVDFVVKPSNDDVVAQAVARGLERTAPIVVAGEEMWTGLRPDRIDALVRRAA